MHLEKGALAGGSSDMNYNLSLTIVAVACHRLVLLAGPLAFCVKGGWPARLFRCYWMIECADSMDFAN